MPKPKRAILALLLGIVVVGLLAFLLHPEPGYHWRSLDSWVTDFHLMEGPGHQKAKEAVRHMGTNALPKLLAMLQAKDSNWKVTLRDWTAAWPLKYRFRPASVDHWRAITALEALGPPAIPVLLDLQKNASRGLLSESDADQARSALVQIGTNGIPSLIKASSNANSETRAQAVAALGWLGSEAQGAFPALVQALKDGDNAVRQAAMEALTEIGAHDIDSPSLLTNKWE